MTSVAADRPGRVNEDYTGALPTAAVLVDGAGIPGGERVCSHGVAWYAHRLGGSLLGLLTLGGDLPSVLAGAIDEVTNAHRGTCDVADPISPSASVAMLRVRDGVAEHLVLGDSFVLLDRIGREALVVTDPREVVIARAFQTRLVGVPAGGDEYRRIIGELRANRNRPGGFWLAKDDPGAAGEAITGSCPPAELNSATLLSNGASRIVDRFGLVDWPGLPALLGSAGPAEIVRLVRDAEAREKVAADDATIAHCTGLGQG
ncbi:hypothetical protein AB0I28_33260 [Phytomonospora sp. NPDC050363]|uniref:hypothetical protein n=1 Tax=Phytomonospora sp. NPDC050363 TaxID=3155642 RepID=UPI0033D36DB5